MTQLRIFLIGAGHIARSHSKTARKIATIYDLGLEIHVADPFEPARVAFGAEFPEAKIYSSPDEMLALPAQHGDIAIIATPPFLHREGALKALASGRDTLVEKPLTLDLQEALDIAQAAQSAGRQFGDCSMRLYDQVSTRELKKRLHEGEIGVPYRVNHTYKGGWGRPGIEYQPQSKWFLDKSKAGGGILVDWAVYDIANLSFLLEPVRVEVRDAWWSTPQTPADPRDVVFDVETHAGAAMVWHLPGGARVHINYERASGTHGKSAHFSEIEGTKGAFEWTWAWNSTSSGVKRNYQDGKTAEEPLEFVDAWEAKHGIGQSDRPLVAFYKRVVLGEDVPSLLGNDSLFNFRVLRAIFDAAETGEMQTVDK
jgi:predicted dehydrogenase